MGLIQIDFLSIVVGYMVGVALMWSLSNTLYGDNNETRAEKDSENIRPRYDRRYHMLYGDSPE
tara:strand:- start:243 stop:431 length:189 start_codon:yes stop_codon:yes gene_type:complete